MANKTCEQRVDERLGWRLEELHEIWEAEKKGEESEEYGPFNEYGISFDYVAPNTFDDQPQGYFRYQLSYGGPSDEFRFYANPDLSVYEIEYWFLDWNDGASRTLSGKDYILLRDIYDFFDEIGVTQAEIDKSME